MGGPQTRSSVVVSEKEGGIIGPPSLPSVCLMVGLSWLGAEPAAAPGAPVTSRGATASRGRGEASCFLELFGSSKTAFLVQASCFACSCVRDGGSKSLLQHLLRTPGALLHPSLQRRPPGGRGTLGLGGRQCWPCAAGPELL